MFLSLLFGAPNPARELQRALKRHGHDVVVDGVWGDETDAALTAFKGRQGLRERPLMGRLTAAALAGPVLPAPSPSPSVDDGADDVDIPPHVAVALREVGVQEVPGAKSNPRIEEYHRATGLGPSKDDVPWCGSFVAFCMQEAGIAYNAATAASARSWLNFGRKTPGPCAGAIAVDWRGDPDGWTGHVQIIIGKDYKGRVLAVSGNKGDRVQIHVYRADRLLGYRYPHDLEMPRIGLQYLPVYDVRAGGYDQSES